GGSASGSNTQSNTQSEGVPFGASQAEYQAAFEDMEPITLHTQTAGPKGSGTSITMEDYVDKIEETSGGKITFEVEYANAIAEPADIDDALRDGRLDLGQVLPIYEPSDYPATNALIESGVLTQGSVVAGTLQSNAWPNEVALNTPEIMNEWDDAGL